MFERNWIILELYEENIYNSREVFEELTPYLDPDHQALLQVQMIPVQRIENTRFFVAPATLFFDLEAIRETKQ